MRYLLAEGLEFQHSRRHMSLSEDSISRPLNADVASKPSVKEHEIQIRERFDNDVRPIFVLFGINHSVDQSVSGN